MPMCNETPTIEVFLCEDSPSPQNPLGVCGAGGMTAVGAAVDDALQSPGLVDCLPIGPSKIACDGSPVRLKRFERSMPSDLIRGWEPVRVKKTRQNKKVEIGSDSIRSE
jgi:hypothetical protein